MEGFLNLIAGYFWDRACYPVPLHIGEDSSILGTNGMLKWLLGRILAVAPKSVPASWFRVLGTLSRTTPFRLTCAAKNSKKLQSMDGSRT